METEPLPFRIQETAGNAFSGKYRASCRKCNEMCIRDRHMDMLLPPELLKAIDPVPFGKYAMQEEHGHFRCV